MKFFPAALLAVTTLTATAQPDAAWFTVMGDLSDPKVDTVQLDLSGVKPRGNIQIMTLRVNLARQRNASPGDPYSSYISQVAIGCKDHAIEHVVQRRFEHQQWRGATTVQEFLTGRPMAFGGLAPNPKAQILKAACAPSK